MRRRFRCQTSDPYVLRYEDSKKRLEVRTMIPDQQVHQLVNDHQILEFCRLVEQRRCKGN